MSETKGQSHDGPILFRPDHELVHPLLESTYRAEANLHLKLEMIDLRTGHIQTVFVRWEDGDLESLSQRVQMALSLDPDADRYEYYFWLFWRGWAGCLDAEMLMGLPAVTADMLSKVGQGIPLRGDGLRRLRSALEWAFADAAGEWGTTETWAEDTISPGHLSLRKKVGKFIQQRMVDLHGPGYEDAPVHT